MFPIARGDLTRPQQHEDVRRAELTVDDSPVAEARSEAKIAFDERRQAAQRRFHVELPLRHDVHRHVPLRPCAHFPAFGAWRVMMKEAQRFGERRRGGAFETSAADHHIDAVAAHISVDAAPEELERALVAMARKDARTPKLEEAPVAM